MESALMVMGGVVIGTAYALIQVAGEPSRDWRRDSVVVQPAMRHAARHAAAAKSSALVPPTAATGARTAHDREDEATMALASIGSHADR